MNIPNELLIKQLASLTVEYEKLKLRLEVHMQTCENIKHDNEITYLSDKMKEYMEDIISIKYKLNLLGKKNN